MFSSPASADLRRSGLPRRLQPFEAIPAFMVPPVFGDEPQLQHLREHLRGRMTFEVLALPDAHASGRLLTDMAATGRTLVEAIERRQPNGPIALMGLSFGASMALEVASQIERAGREIGFLGILDGPFEPPEVARPAAASLAAPRKLIKSVVVDAAETMDAVRRLMLNAVTPADAEAARAEPMRRAMLWHLRNKALKRWRPNGCRAPGLHVWTGTYGRANRERWAELCPNLDAVHVEAVHEHLLKDAALDAVVAALIPVIEAVARPREGVDA